MESCNHTLDLIITRTTENFVEDVNVHPEFYSDHGVITSTLNHPKPPRSDVTVTHRSILDREKFSCDIIDSFSRGSSCRDDVNALVSIYNDTLLKTYDKHAPLKTITVKHCRLAKWYNDQLLHERVGSVVLSVAIGSLVGLLLWKFFMNKLRNTITFSRKQRLITIRLKYRTLIKISFFVPIIICSSLNTLYCVRISHLKNLVKILMTFSSARLLIFVLVLTTPRQPLWREGSFRVTSWMLRYLLTRISYKF